MADRWHSSAPVQFTHPGRGATSLPRTDVREMDVSIHAPREGCDVLFDADRGALDKFQFTHPGRGATDLLKTF